MLLLIQKLGKVGLLLLLGRLEEVLREVLQEVGRGVECGRGDGFGEGFGGPRFHAIEGEEAIAAPCGVLD